MERGENYERENGERDGKMERWSEKGGLYRIWIHTMLRVKFGDLSVDFEC